MLRALSLQDYGTREHQVTPKRTAALKRELFCFTLGLNKQHTWVHMLGWGRAVCYCSIVSPVLTNKALSAPAFPTGSQRIVLSSSSLGSCESHALCECLLKAILTMSHPTMRPSNKAEFHGADRKRPPCSAARVAGTGQVHSERHFPGAVNCSSLILPSSKC